ncbi:MAG: sugar ABC transporter permease, partial [Firmicutes bacterium]|nr:sugar ABC transporter permease [Bacillota bacterium]
IVILVAILNQVLSPVSGLYGAFYHLFGGEGYPKDIRASADAFRHLYVWSGVWQNIGWSTIIYLASLSAVSSELHEAAEIDGASRWKRVLHVDLPTILPTVGIMLILRCGHVISVGFEKTFLMQNSLNISKSEVISTYVYKKGLGNSNQFSFGAAISLFNSIINCILMLTVNWISKKASDDEVSLF